MSFITKYGGFWGMIPQTSGKVFFVAPSDSYTLEGKTYSASDNHLGDNPDKALRTLGRAMDLVTATAGDVIVLLPGAHSLTAQESIDVAGVTITGLPSGKGHPNRMRTSLTTSAADETLLIGASNVELAYIHFIPVTAQASIEANNSADYLYIHDCTCQMITPTANTATMFFQSIATSSGLTNLVIENCYVETVGGQGPALDLNDCAYATIKDCTFRLQGGTAWADAVVSATGALDVLFENCKWLSGTAAVITDPIDWTGNTDDITAILRQCFFTVGTGVINGSADADFAVDSLSEIAQTAAGGSAIINVLNAG